MMRFCRTICAALMVCACIPAALLGAEEELPKFTPDVVYGHKDGLALTMDVYRPEGEANGAAILFMVSGGWYSRWAPPEQTKPLFQPYLDAGFTMFAVRHGSSPRYGIPEIVSDVQQALKYVHEHADALGVDANRLGAMGMSAGGHLALMLGTLGTAPAPGADEGESNGNARKDDDGDDKDESSARVAAVVALVPPTDLRVAVWESPESLPVYRSFPALNLPLDKADDYSPVTNVTPDDAPALVVMGGKDDLVPPKHGEWIKEALDREKVPNKLIIFPDAGHGLEGADNRETLVREAVAWFQTHLSESARPDEEQPDEARKRVRELIQAAAMGQLDVIQRMQAEGVDLNARLPGELSAYWAAKIRGYKAIAEYLESQGANTPSEFSASRFLDELLGDPNYEDKPGVAVLVARDGEIIYQRGAGLANVEHQVPVTTETKFRIGSVTKQFTAAAILKLQEEGKLSVTDPLSKYVPDFPRGDEVTLHHMLTHTSGIHSFTEKPEFLEAVTVGAQPEEWIETFKSDPYDFNPGEKFHYSNSGYFLLGYIVAKVSGQSYEEYLKHTFFDPLEMRDSGAHTQTAILMHEATGYNVSESNVEKAVDWDMSKAGGAGSLYSTVGDLFRWNEGIFNGKVLQPESLEQAFRPVGAEPVDGLQMNYGYGWMIDEYRGLKRISHSGGLPGYLSHLARFPGQRMTIVVLHNAMMPVGEWSPARLAERIAELYLWDQMRERSVHEVAQVEPKLLDDYVGRYAYSSSVMHVTREGDRLFAQLLGQPKHEIFPEGEDKFFWKVVDAQVEFLREEGKVTAAKHFQNGVSIVAPRMDDEPEVEVSEETLDRYAGKYDYSGIGILTVRRDGKQLKAQLAGQPEFEIYAKSKDTFFWKVVRAEVQFVTDEAGNVTKALHKQGTLTIEAKKIE